MRIHLIAKLTWLRSRLCLIKNKKADFWERFTIYTESEEILQ